MSLPHVVLRCLMDGPGHGYALQKQAAQLRHFYPLNNINIYPVLRDLEKAGWVTSHTEIANSRARNVYAITVEGVAAFTAWIDERPDDHFALQNDAVGLKLLLAEESDAHDLGWIEGVIEGLDGEIDRLRKEIETRRAESTRLAQLTREWRLAAYTQRRCYLERALEITQGDPTL